MSQSKRLALLAGAALSLGGVAHAAPQTQSSDEVRAIVAEMLADAQTRSSLLAGGGSDPFTLSSSDGASTLKIGGQIQFRYYLNLTDDSGADEFDSGFETRRTKLNISGQINENWKYNVQGNFSRNGGAFGLEDAWVGYDLGDGMSVSWGQGKLPGLREEMVSSKYQLAMERSVVNEVFTLGRAQGIALHYNQDDWRGAITFSDGVAFPAPGTGITSDPGANNVFTSTTEGDWAFSARGEYKLDGEWGQFKDFTSGQGDAYAAMIGAGLHYGVFSETGSNTSTNTTDNTVLQYTFDLSLEGDSWNAFAGFVGRNTTVRMAGADTETDDFGVVIQGGFRMQEDTEIFARWDGIFFDSSAAADDTNFITVGVNKYYAGHAAKATMDVVFGLDEVTAGLTDGGAGLRTDPAGEDGQVAVRFQFQLLF